MTDGNNLRYISDKKKNIVIGQSIKAGSEISSKTTITVTLSNGKGEEKVEERKETTPSRPREDDDNHENDSTPSVPDTPEVTPTCNSCSFRASQIISTLQQYNTYESAASGLRSYLATRILNQNGFDSYNFAGGYRLYSSIHYDRLASSNSFACGMEK